MATAATEANCELLRVCLDFASNFKDKSSFYFTVKTGDFLLTVKHGDKKASDDQTGKDKKKYVSPSTRTRNFHRLLAYRARKKDQESGGKGVDLPSEGGAPG